MSPTRKAAFRVALAALFAAVIAGAVLQGSAWLAHGGEELDSGWWWASLIASALAGGLAAAVVVRRSFGTRLTKLAETLDGRVEDTDFLERLPEMGGDEVGRIAKSFNRVLARVTALQGHVIDRDIELESTLRALRLAEELAAKQHELEQRLEERALLFEVLRESTSSHDLEKVLEVLVTRIGPALRADRIAVLLHTESGGLEVRAAWGFAESPVGRELARPSTGPWSVDRGMMVVPDVSRTPGAVRFWDELPRTGSFAAGPITHRDDEIGLLVLTRSEDDPLGEIAGRYLEAVADHAAMAIFNAQLVVRLEDLSTHDELTGLPNRRLFDRRLERAIAWADRYGHELSVLALDIDHFKHLNDANGHAAGDTALVALAETLGSSLREVDTAARVGGEELWVLLPDTRLDAAVDVAEKLRLAVAALDVPGAAGQPLGHFSVSIGVATRATTESRGSLLERADEALYRAKRDGRDRVAASAEVSRPGGGGARRTRG